LAVIVALMVASGFMLVAAGVLVTLGTGPALIAAGVLLTVGAWLVELKLRELARSQAKAQ
jgi:hypothetical protein